MIDCPGFRIFPNRVGWSVSVFRSKTAVPVKRVWRISLNAPLGAWVDSVPARQPGAVPASSVTAQPSQADADGHWLMSSFDLLSGVDVTENPDTVPGELIDELFGPRMDVAKGPGR
jgi:hypothetical protein